MSVIFFICFISLARITSSVSLANTYEAPCPEVKVVDNFNIEKFSEDAWYEIARYANNWEKRGDCTKLSFERDSIGIKFIATNVVDNHKLNKVEGYIDYASKTNKSGVIKFKSKAFEDSEGINIVPVYILNVVYDKYFIAYDCQYDESKKFRHDYLWISSKTKKFDSQSKIEVDSLIKSLTFIDPDKLIWDHFTEESCKIES